MTASDLPKRGEKIIQLAKKHGWEVHHEGVHEGDVFGSPDTFELYVQRWFGDREAVWTLKWERPHGGGRWKSTTRALGALLNEYDEDDVNIGTDYDRDNERRFKALSHVEYWLAHPNEVVSWPWLTGAGEAG